MNYPIWDVPGAGLLIAFIAVLHVFVSHFAIGGGLFLVLAERKARREQDTALLDYVRRHSRFFILVTLVLGAVTGVGIWFTIALVNPQGTSSLINTFVWGWAAEWTFFIAEIAAAMIYYYGWDRLTAKTHMAVGWIYFGAAWMSLFVINGIITYMLTPGAWVTTRGFWDGFFNPTFWPSLVARTFVAIGLAGIYTFVTLARSSDPALKGKVARWAGAYWVLPMAVAVPLSLIWYLAAAMGAGIPAGAILGAQSESLGAAIVAIFTGGPGGYPVAQNGALVAIVASLVVAALTLVIAFVRRSSFSLPEALVVLVAGLLAFGGGEWVREDLRKPYVIGQHMFVNSIRLPASPEAPQPPESAAEQMDHAFTVEKLNRTGVLKASLWLPSPEGFDAGSGPVEGLSPEQAAQAQAEAGEQIFKALCYSCHTVDGYVAIRPLVEGQSVSAIENTLDTLARPVDAEGNPTGWDDPHLQLATRLGRRMPPFVGTAAEKRALAVYLARLGGREDAGLAQETATEETGGAHPGEPLFEGQCAMCHAEGSEWPMRDLVEGRTERQLFEDLGRLPELDPMMPPFEGTEDERRHLAEWLVQFGEAPQASEAGGGEGPDGRAVFENNCAMCHGQGSEWPMVGYVKGRSQQELYESIGRLEQLNPMMPPFTGSDAEREALARYLAGMN
jgi:mono/diheme cytochrome c family protein